MRRRRCAPRPSGWTTPRPAWFLWVSFSASMGPMTWARSRCVGGVEGMASSASSVRLSVSNSLRQASQASMWPRTAAAVSASSLRVGELGHAFAAGLAVHVSGSFCIWK